MMSAFSGSNESGRAKTPSHFNREAKGFANVHSGYGMPDGGVEQF